MVVALMAAAAAGVPASDQPEDFATYLDDLYEGTIRTIAPDEVDSWRRERPLAIVLDVRTAAERSVSFVAGSEFHDFESFDIDPFLSLPRDTAILTYCAVGYRSERVGEQFVAAGFRDVWHVYGGIIEWQNRSLPLEAGPTLLLEASIASPPVHGYEPQWGRYVTGGNVVYDPPVD